MNVYDEANNLAKALGESDEYKRYKAAENALKDDEKNLAIAKDFAQKQMDMHTKQMMGQQPTEEEIEAFNTMAQAAMGIPVINEYFQSQMYFGMIFQDIMNIITNAVELDMDILSDEAKPSEEEKTDK